MNGFLFFTPFGPGGIELWRSDGTAAGTARVKDINPGSGSSRPANLTVLNGVLYFSANGPALAARSGAATAPPPAPRW